MYKNVKIEIQKGNLFFMTQKLWLCDHLLALIFTRIPCQNPLLKM